LRERSRSGCRYVRQLMQALGMRGARLCGTPPSMSRTGGQALASACRRPKRSFRTQPSYFAPSRCGIEPPPPMPRREDLRKILIIGSGPIVIGQACEFDYSGTQGAKALAAEGYEIVLVNSNPATIMTDPELASRTYIEPLEPATLRRILERERPCAVLPTLGGQTALNLALA